jgi:hypothetical protein
VEQDKQEGLIPLDIVEVGTLRIGSKGAAPDEALACWIEAHTLHKQGKLAPACERYITFLSMSGHRSLPRRYAEMARERLEALHDPVRKTFERSCRTYRTDRARGVAIWKSLASEWSMLPEGVAALKLWQSDELREAIDAAKLLQDQGKKKEAVGPLEKAVRALPHGLYRYEATTLLVDLGGPDLRPKKWRGAGKDEREGADPDRPEKKDGDGDESEIEIND